VSSVCVALLFRACLCLAEWREAERNRNREESVETERFAAPFCFRPKKTETHLQLRISASAMDNGICQQPWLSCESALDPALAQSDPVLHTYPESILSSVPTRQPSHTRQSVHSTPAIAFLAHAIAFPAQPCSNACLA
jgi:hypothetical protein